MMMKTKKIADANYTDEQWRTMLMPQILKGSFKKKLGHVFEMITEDYQKNPAITDKMYRERLEKASNAKSVKVNTTAVSLAVGKNFTIKAEQVVKDQPIKKHTEIKFESSNSKVASVTGKGVIKAKKKGTCYIYVYAQNGVYQKIKVTVK